MYYFYSCFYYGASRGISESEEKTKLSHLILTRFFGLVYIFLELEVYHFLYYSILLCIDGFDVFIVVCKIKHKTLMCYVSIKHKMFYFTKIFMFQVLWFYISYVWDSHLTTGLESFHQGHVRFHILVKLAFFIIKHSQDSLRKTIRKIEIMSGTTRIHSITLIINPHREAFCHTFLHLLMLLLPLNGSDGNLFDFRSPYCYQR